MKETLADDTKREEAQVKFQETYKAKEKERTGEEPVVEVKQEAKVEVKVEEKEVVVHHDSPTPPAVADTSAASTYVTSLAVILVAGAVRSAL